MPTLWVGGSTAGHVTSGAEENSNLTCRDFDSAHAFNGDSLLFLFSYIAVVRLYTIYTPAFAVKLYLLPSHPAM